MIQNISGDQGERDTLKAGLPVSLLKIYPDAGHAPHWEHPERFASDLNAIFSGKAAEMSEL